MDRRERWTTAPLDTRSAEHLAAGGLRYGLVDTADAAVFEPWLRAVDRGFLGSRSDDARIARMVRAFGDRRTTGVWDDAAPEPQDPVATVNAWIGELTLSPGRTVESWAISDVTVSPTHRRRGIARDLLEGELRVAAGLGLPAAMLTVSESTLYARYGFGPASMSTALRFETARTRWTGPETTGRVDHVTPERAGVELARLHGLARTRVPGDTDSYSGNWGRLTGEAGDAAETAPVRAVLHTDAAGEVTGGATYRIAEDGDDFTKHTLDVIALVTVDDDAYAALWRYLLEMPLVSVVRAGVRAVDEPVRWMVDDFRGVEERVADHQWLRVLDPVAILGGRAYAGGGRLALEVTDPLGFAAGTFAIEADAEGEAEATRVEGAPEGPLLRLDASTLGSIVLGTVRPTTLVRAGRITEGAPGDAAVADRLLAPARAPWLSTWY